MAILYVKDKNGRRIPIPAIKGENGHQMFVRFSAYADGTDMNETWDDTRDYMGIVFAVDVAPADKAAYQWIRVSHFPNGMTLDEDNNLHVKGEITFGEDKFSPREEIKKKANSKHSHKAQDVTNLSVFMQEYLSARIATGEYVGTGHEREDDNVENMFVAKTVTVTFPIPIKRAEIFLIYEERDARGTLKGYRRYLATVLVNGTDALFLCSSDDSYVEDEKKFNMWVGKVSDDGKALSWGLEEGWVDKSLEKLNANGTTYHYTAIG